MTAMSIPYLALDMRNPKKCVVFDYPGTQLEIVYEIFGKSYHSDELRIPFNASKFPNELTKMRSIIADDRKFNEKCTDPHERRINAYITIF